MSHSAQSISGRPLPPPQDLVGLIRRHVAAGQGDEAELPAEKSPRFSSVRALRRWLDELPERDAGLAGDWHDLYQAGCLQVRELKRQAKLGRLNSSSERIRAKESRVQSAITRLLDGFEAHISEESRRELLDLLSARDPEAYKSAFVVKLLFHARLLLDRTKDPDAATLIDWVSELFWMELSSERRAEAKAYVDAKRAAAPDGKLRLASDRHPILSLFVSKVPRGGSRKQQLMAGSVKGEVRRERLKVRALDEPYIETNKLVRGVLRVDLDGTISTEEILAICDQADIPFPQLAVGREDASGRLVHPHLLWLLNTGVNYTPSGKPQTRYFFEAILRGLTKVFIPHGADIGGLSNPHRHKNPVSTNWHCEILFERPYDLGDFRPVVERHSAIGDLREAVRQMHGDAMAEQIRSSRLHGRGPVPEPAEAAAQFDHSNGMFEYLSRYARSLTPPRHERTDERLDLFQTRVAEAARDLNSRLSHRHQLKPRNLDALVRSVTKWCWEVYNGAYGRGLQQPLPPEEAYRRMADNGRRTAARRADANLRALIEASDILARQRIRLDRVNLHGAVQSIKAMSLRTVQRHWRKLMEAVSNRRPPDDTPGSGRGSRRSAVRDRHVLQVKAAGSGSISFLPSVAAISPHTMRTLPLTRSVFFSREGGGGRFRFDLPSADRISGWIRGIFQPFQDGTRPLPRPQDYPLLA